SPAFLLTGKTAVCVLAVVAVLRWLLAVTTDEPSLPRGVVVRRFGVLMVLVVAVNLTWHFFRAWLPLFLVAYHHYSPTGVGGFNTAYYFASDAGSLASGFAATLLARRLRVHTSRLIVFGACALLTTLSVAAALLPAGPALLAVLLVIAFGSLGVFPI